MQESQASQDGVVAGAVRVCLDAPIAATRVAVGTCVWQQDRRRILGVSVELEVGGRRIAVDFQRVDPLPAGTAVRLLGPGGGAGFYRQAAGSAVRLEAGPRRQVGTVTFAQLAFTADDAPAPSPLAGSDTLSGRMSWSCQDPPPLAPGFSPGTVEIHFDDPVARDVTAEAVCAWLDHGGERRVLSISARVRAYVAGRVVGVGLQEPALGPPESRPGPEVSVDVALAQGATRTFSGGRTLLLEGRPDGAAGRARVIELTAQAHDFPYDAIAGTPFEEWSSAIVSWTCDPAPRGTPRASWQPADVVDRPGSLMLTLNELDVTLNAEARCIGGNPGPPQLVWSRMELGGEQVTVRVEAGRLDLSLWRTDAAGRYLGEYVGDEPVGHDGQYRDDGWGRWRFGDLPLSGNGREYPPLGGPDGPRVLSGDLEWNCP